MAASALLHFLLLPAYHRLHPALHERTGGLSYLGGDQDWDPYLAGLSPEQLAAVSAGHHYVRYRLADHRGEAEASGHLRRFEELSPPGSTRVLSPARELLRPLRGG